jgi:hypothetical protein
VVENGEGHGAMRNATTLLGKHYSESRNVSTRFLCWSVSAL